MWKFNQSQSLYERGASFDVPLGLQWTKKSNYVLYIDLGFLSQAGNIIIKSSDDVNGMYYRTENNLFPLCRLFTQSVNDFKKDIKES